MMSRVGLYVRTLRHLKPIQVFSRFKVPLPSWNCSNQVRLRLRTRAWTPPIPRPAAKTGRRRFRFLNQVRSLIALFARSDFSFPLIHSPLPASPRFSSGT